MCWWWVCVWTVIYPVLFLGPFIWLNWDVVVIVCGVNLYNIMWYMKIMIVVVVITHDQSIHFWVLDTFLWTGHLRLESLGTFGAIGWNSFDREYFLINAYNWIVFFFYKTISVLIVLLVSFDIWLYEIYIFNISILSFRFREFQHRIVVQVKC